MPLSEDDQRRLDEIERALQRDDPKFAAGHSLKRTGRWHARTSIPAGNTAGGAGRLPQYVVELVLSNGCRDLGSEIHRPLLTVA